MVDIIEKAKSMGKMVCVNSSKDYLELMELAKRKGYTWYLGDKPINKRYDLIKGLPLLIGFYLERDRKYLNFTKNMGYAHIDYESKRGNTLW